MSRDLHVAELEKMAATEVDEESWLYGGGYTPNSKADDGVRAKPEDGARSGSLLLDDLDDVIVNAEMKQHQHRTGKIVSISSNLQPKVTTPSKDAKTPVVDEDGVFDLEQGEEGEGEEGGQESKAGEGGEQEEEEEESEESDEDDVQIVIGPIENPPAPFYQGRLPSTSNAVLTGPKKVDVDAVPTIGSQTLFEIDLDSADKPWRLPGADITDYFNYGFTEETWRLYCEKQRRTKTEVAQLNKIAVHTTRIGTFPKSGMITSFSTIPSICGSSFPPPRIHPYPLPPAGLPMPHTLLPPPPLPHLHAGLLPPILHEPPSSLQESLAVAQTDRDDGSKTPEPANEREGSEGRATPGVDQETPEVMPPTGKVPLLPPPPTSMAPSPFSMPPPIRTNTSGAPDVANAMAAMFGGLRQPDHPFPGFLPPPGFPPPFHPQLAGGDFRPRVPPFHGGPPPPFPLLPGGHLDVPGLLPHLDERGLPMHPDLGLAGGTWDPSMGPPPPELFDMMARREDFPRGSRSPSRSGSSGRSRSRSRSSSYDDRGRRRRDKRIRRHSRSRSHSRDRERERHPRSSRRSHRSNHHRSERHDRDRDRDREREKERERERRRRDERSRRERSRRHRSSSRDREEERSSASGRGTRDRKKDPPPREERSHSQTPT